MTRWARLARYLSHAYVDLRIFLAGKADPELPPLRKSFVGAGDFRATGRHLAELVARLGDLEPGHRVLDIGCGIGRVALALTRHLGPGGSYEGFDVVPASIRWCRRHITGRDPRFRFTRAAVYNSEYNRRGVPATSFRFPYPDADFDLAFATSVFTHLAVEETAHYLSEAARVLAPGGRLVASFLLLDERFARATPAPGFELPVVRERHRLMDAANPAAAIALEVGLARELVTAAGLELEEPIHFGSWCGGTGSEEPVSFQDFVVARKPG